MPDVDATVVERLRDAGAVLVAKLSMGSLAQGGVWFGGTTRNPWAPETGSSGSSAGPAAATAAGLVGFALGTETRGSIIITPASICGVVGLRPTYGRVSRYGAMALSWTMDKIGPMCRSVEDCALVFNAIYGTDGRDDTVVDAPFAWNPDVPLATIRIGYVARSSRTAARRPKRAKRFELRSAQRRAGCTARERREARADRAAGLPHRRDQFHPERRSGGGLRRSDAQQGNRSADRAGARRVAEHVPHLAFIPAVEYIRAQRARTLLIRKMDALMSTVRRVPRAGTEAAPACRSRT